ncbi:hypothetical protein IEO21_09634 [Rhodonia placenta]|uniref:Uncharacterized protein n=1 Tax=Rhodonia placenta TaxID=104341 RepID=A0A8H7NTZ0_9APHY|nr:hypothetical protein IEO21_09634 [Postia placenta]
MADKFFDCSRLEHTFNTQEQVNVSRDDPESDRSSAPFFICDRQPCPNCTPRSITAEEGCYVPIRRVQHPSGPTLRYTGTITKPTNPPYSLILRGGDNST